MRPLGATTERMRSFDWPVEDGWPYPDTEQELIDPDGWIDDDAVALRATPPRLDEPRSPRAPGDHRPLRPRRQPAPHHEGAPPRPQPAPRRPATALAGGLAKLPQPTSWAATSPSTAQAKSASRGAWSDGQLALAGEAVDEGPRDAVGQHLGGQDEVDAQAPALVEVAGPVVPPRVEAVLVVALAEDVDQAPLLQGRHRLPLGRADVGAAVELGGVPDVAVVGGDVEVAADDQRLGRVAAQ